MRLLIAGTLLARGAPLVWAQQPRVPELGDMSLEQLVDVQIVSAASKRAQKVSEAPSVVMVVTAAEIRRHGYRTLADALRTLPGFYVTYDRNYSYLGVRGFGRPGDYNTRILLLVDGVRTNDNIYDGAYVAHEFMLDPDLIERVEVSRGPGASVYGNSALFAVVNVVTRRGGDIGGGELAGSAASFGTYKGRASFGRKLADGSELLASATLRDSDGQDLSFPEFTSPGERDGVAKGLDWERTRKFLGSYAKGGFSVEAIAARREKGIPTAPFGTAFGDTLARTSDTWGLAFAGYRRKFGENFDWSARLGFGAYDYRGAYPYGVEEASLWKDGCSGRWWNAESVGTLEAGRHTLLFGTEFQHHFRMDQDGAYAGQPAELRVRGSERRYAFFAQDDLMIGAWLRASLGARYDHYPEFGGEAHPRLALILSPDPRTTVRLLYGSAFRAPNQYEQHYYSAQPAGLEPEHMRTLEGTLERQLGSSVRVSAALFSNSIRDLLTLDANQDERLFFRNTGRITSSGGELALETQFGHGAAGRLSYSYQRTRDEAGASLTNSPAHMLKANLDAPVLREKVWASADAQYVGSRRTLTGGRTPSFVLLNATLYAKDLGHGLEASASVYNALRTRYADPGSEEHRQAVIPQDGRSFAVRLGWRF
jgi:iron complex outermembrane receptor protein